MANWVTSCHSCQILLGTVQDKNETVQRKILIYLIFLHKQLQALVILVSEPYILPCPLPWWYPFLCSYWFSSVLILSWTFVSSHVLLSVLIVSHARHALLSNLNGFYALLLNIHSSSPKLQEIKSSFTFVPHCLHTNWLANKPWNGRWGLLQSLVRGTTERNPSFSQM